MGFNKSILLTISLSVTYIINCFSVDKIIYLGNNREIFVDRFLIEELRNCYMQLQTPVDRGSVLYFDQPWEGPFSSYSTVLKDTRGYKLYYRGVDVDNNENVTCLATSNDGIHWTKPILNIVEIHGSHKNNVILKGGKLSHNFSPFIDKATSSIKTRYKAIAGKGKEGIYGFASEDGVHWNLIKESPLLQGYSFDSQNVVFWSTTENKYLCYFRSWTHVNFKKYRTVSLSKSDDFYTWSKPMEMTYGETNREHIYTNQTHPYYRAPHIYIALAARFVPGCKVLTKEELNKIHVHKKYINDCSDIVLMSARSGCNVYHREFMEAFVKPGLGPENWISRTNYPALNIVQTSSEEMSFYVNHNYAQPTAHLRRYTLRIDGFTSISAKYELGKFLTKPFIFKGKDLFINYATSAVGYIKIEIQNIDGEVYKGYTFDDCEIIKGNEISYKVVWSNNDVSKLENIPVRLNFVLKDADLFSLRFR